jgi:GTP-binding protein
MFVDLATITVEAGDGGNGIRSFRREKFVPFGGPDGGDGGRGADIVLVADLSRSTLLHFRYNNLFRAPRGRHGQGADKTGRSGEEMIVAVPVGTVVMDQDGVEILCDFTEEGQRWVAAVGGDGGRGNARFSTSINRAPSRCESGHPGQVKKLRLQLKLLADVGLVGLPNAGKSTLISRISAAKPKIADYPFTTLEPQLGVVDAGDYQSFVVADIPGLIEGAHEGAGLGDRFLRHIERCTLLLHLVDVSDPTQDPIAAIESIERELDLHHPELMAKPRLLVLTKADAVQDSEVTESVLKWATDRGVESMSISSVRGDGLQTLVRWVSQRLNEKG